VVVEDAPVGLEAARAAGMRAIALTTTHAAAQLMTAAWGLRALAHIRATSGDGGLQLDLHDALWTPAGVSNREDRYPLPPNETLQRAGRRRPAEN
jgi:hypothetical protein